MNALPSFRGPSPLTASAIFMALGIGCLSAALVLVLMQGGTDPATMHTGLLPAWWTRS